MSATHASCVELESHFQGCSSDLDAIARTLEGELQRSALYRRVLSPHLRFPPAAPQPSVAPR
jgi:hypothetical protein